MGGMILYAKPKCHNRACILVGKNINAMLLPEFCLKDMTVAKVFYQEGDEQRELIITSAYLPYKEDHPPSQKIRDIVTYSHYNNKEFILGCGVNANHTVWRSCNTNTKGEN
jgi:hypothetical protein